MFQDFQENLVLFNQNYSQLQLSLESHNVRSSGVGFILSSHRIAFILDILLFGIVLSVLEEKKNFGPTPSPLEWPILP